MMARYLIVYSVFFSFLGCSQEDQRHANQSTRNLTYLQKDTSMFVRQEMVYVPVYSDIYPFDETSKFLLTITLSLRNTSLTDSLYFEYVRYYDSVGNLLRNYLDSMIVLKPLESVDFVVENRESQGGTGANFLVAWGAADSITLPVIQAVMIGTTSQQGISFVTEGTTIEKKIKK